MTQKFIQKIQRSIDYLLSKISSVEKEINNISSNLKNTNVTLSKSSTDDFFPGSVVIPSRKAVSIGGSFATRINDIIGVPFRIESRAIVTGMSINVSVATGSSIPMTSAIYKYNNNSWSLVDQIPVGNFNSQLTGYQSISFSSNVTLEPGIYFHCIQSSVQVTLKSSVSDNFDNVFGLSNISTNANKAIQIPYSWNNGVLPNTITSWGYAGLNFGHSLINIL